MKLTKVSGRCSGSEMVRQTDLSCEASQLAKTASQSFRTFGGGHVKKTLLTVRNVFGVVGLIYTGYVLFRAIPDLRRYIKITTM